MNYHRGKSQATPTHASELFLRASIKARRDIISPPREPALIKVLAPEPGPAEKLPKKILPVSSNPLERQDPEDPENLAALGDDEDLFDFGEVDDDDANILRNLDSD